MANEVLVAAARSRNSVPEVEATRGRPALHNPEEKLSHWPVLVREPQVMAHGEMRKYIDGSPRLTVQIPTTVVSSPT